MHHGTRTRSPSAIATGSRWLRAGVVCALLAGVVGACTDINSARDVSGPPAGSDPPGNGGPSGPPTHMAIYAGDSQTVAPGTAVPIPPAVRVNNQYGHVVSGAHVLFTVAAGGGSVVPDDVTTDTNGVATVGSWTLGTTKGKNVLTASVGQGLEISFTAAAGATSPDVTVRLAKVRGVDVIVADTLPVAVYVTSRYELASVTATVGTAHAALSYSTENKRWEGDVLLKGLPRDTVELDVTATDVNGSATDAFQTYVHDLKPTLTITGPDSGTIARPSIDFSADCADDDPAGCRSLVVAVTANKDADLLSLATGQSHVSGTASLADFDGYSLYLDFKATDSRGQIVRAFRQVYVEASTKLSEIATVDGRAMDFRGGHILYRGVDGMISLRDITSGATQALYPDTAFRAAPPYGYVTSTGAIFAVDNPALRSTRAFEWRNGTLVDLGGLDAYLSLQVGGNYAIFSSNGTLTRRDLATGTNTSISTSATDDNDVAPNGDVVFSGRDYRVYRYHDGTTTLLTPDDGTGLPNTGPVTDGVNVVYTKGTPCCNSPQTHTIILHADTGDIVLAPARPQAPIPERPQPLNETDYVRADQTDYAVNGGWTAFTTLGTGGVLQVWTRSPTGELRQVSFFGTDSKISALASDGTVIFENGGRRYLVPPGGAPEDIMSRVGRVVWCDGRFIAFIGGTVFAITP